MAASVNNAPRENAWLWLVKIIAGLLIVILLGIHFVINHLVAPEGLLSYADVLSYYQVWFVPLMEIIFLVVVITHALVGVRSILLDLNLSAQLVKGITWILLMIGAGGILYGIWIVIRVVNAGA